MIGTRDAEVALDLGEDVLQRRRHVDAGHHREAQPVRLVRAVIRILPEDHDLDRVERRRVERREDLRSGRIDDFAGVLFGAQEFGQAHSFRGR